MDSRLRMPLKSRLVREAAGDLLVFTAKPLGGIAQGERSAASRSGNFQAGGAGERVDLRKVIRELGRREILNVLLEAGAELNGASLRANIVDKLLLFLAPKIAGGGHVPIARSYWPRIAAAPTLRLAQLRTSAGRTWYWRDTFTMFTGIVQDTGKIDSFEHGPLGGRLRVRFSNALTATRPLAIGREHRRQRVLPHRGRMHGGFVFRRSFRRDSGMHRVP